MKRFLISTTALAVALAQMQPITAAAQVTVQVGNDTVMCLALAETPCPEGATCVVAPEPPCNGIDEATFAAAIAAQSEAEARAAAAGQSGATLAPPAEEEPATQAAPTDPAPETLPPSTAAAPQAPASGPQAPATAGDAAAEAEKAARAEAARTERAARKAAETEAAKAEKAAKAEAAKAARAAERAARAKANQAAGTDPAPVVVTTAPVSEEAVQTLTDILSAPSEAEAPAAAAAEPAAAPAEAVETTVTAEQTRTSAQDFAPAQPAATAQGRSRMSDLEKFGLAVLGGLVVGAILQNGDKVVSNTGDRVVIERDDGTFAVLKDDDTLIRRPGSNVRTETFADGSTRATVLRADGSRIVTIRDAAGRVLRRARIAPDGRETVLIDDLAPAPRIDVTTLPAPRPETRFIQPDANDAALRAALLGAQTRQIGRTFSLRQIRDHAEVRAQAPTIGVESITFETGSAAIRPSEAAKLARLGRFMAELIATNPAEMFLIEGHTDAVGSAASNLALSDRRAESLALALTEYFGVPPENMVVQGYGEAELLIPTQAAEVRNRRTAVRMISPLLPASFASR